MKLGSLKNREVGKFGIEIGKNTVKGLDTSYHSIYIRDHEAK